MNRRRWNELGRRFERNVCDVADSDRSHVFQALVEKAMPDRDHGVLVDLGCGVGTFVRMFADRFHSVIATDYSPNMLIRARSENGAIANVTWLTCEITKACASLSGAADLVACLNVITSTSVQQRNRLFRAVAAATKVGGHALIVVPSVESEMMVDAAVAKANGERPPRLNPNGVFMHGGDAQKHFARSELRGTLRTFDLSVVALERASYRWSEVIDGDVGRRTGKPWDWACLARRLPAHVGVTRQSFGRVARD